MKINNANNLGYLHFYLNRKFVSYIMPKKTERSNIANDQKVVYNL